MKYGIRVRPWSLWLGAHYAPYNKRLCLNLIPCVTIWVVWPGGITP